MQNLQTATKSARPVTPANIIASKLEQLQTLARQLAYADPSFGQLLDEAVALATGLEDYLTICTSVESGALAALAAGTRSENWQHRFTSGGTTLPLEQEMMSGHLEGQFLKMLVHAIGARRVLEIGLFTGYSALAMAEALPDDGLLIACEIDPFAADYARAWFAKSSHGQKIRVDVGPAKATLDRLAAAGNTFDFVFVDADKGGYWSYVDTLLTTQLLAPNALVCIDNTLMQGQPYMTGAPSENGRAIADFNRRVAEDSRVEQVLIPLRDGITLIRRI